MSASRQRVDDANRVAAVTGVSSETFAGEFTAAAQRAAHAIVLLHDAVCRVGPTLARAVRAARADLSGKHDLATVIRQQPGRQIVRDGLADVRHWAHDCGCYDRDPLERGWCPPAWERVDAAVLDLATRSPLSVRALRQLVIDFLELPAVEHLAQHEDVVDVAVAWLRAAEGMTVRGVPGDAAGRLGVGGQW